MEAQWHGALTFCSNRALVEWAIVYSTLSATHKSWPLPEKVVSIVFLAPNMQLDQQLHMIRLLNPADSNADTGSVLVCAHQWFFVKFLSQWDVLTNNRKHAWWDIWKMCKILSKFVCIWLLIFNQLCVTTAWAEHADEWQFASSGRLLPAGEQGAPYTDGVEGKKALNAISNSSKFKIVFFPLVLLEMWGMPTLWNLVLIVKKYSFKGESQCYRLWVKQVNALEMLLW